MLIKCADERIGVVGVTVETSPVSLILVLISFLNPSKMSLNYFQIILSKNIKVIGTMTIIIVLKYPF